MAQVIQPVTWKDVVRHALGELGGTAHLRQINDKLKNHPKTKTNPTWKATIRRVVQQYAIFEAVEPTRSGVYRLVPELDVHAKPAKAGHGSVQGMLLVLGRLYGYETFAPATDRTRQSFQGKPLAEYSSVKECDSFAKGAALRTVSQIDALWLKNDSEGAYPVFAFEVENSTKVRSGMDRMSEIPERYRTRMFVIGPGREEQLLFQRYYETNRFRKFQGQFFYRSYEQLDSLYDSAVKHDAAGSIFGVEPNRQ